MRPTRSSRYRFASDLESWRSDRRVNERGFAHRWSSVVADGNGEDMFIELLDEHIAADLDVLDLGCGHGEFTLQLAPRVRSITGIERHSEYLELANELAAETDAANARFLQAELAGPHEEHRGGSLPLPDRSVDLIVDRRGPVLDRYIDDLLRVARPGATIVGLHPAGGPPRPSWIDLTPTLADRFAALRFEDVVSWVVDPLTRLSIHDYEYWWIDVAEYLDSPESLHARVAADLDYNVVAAECERAFDVAAVDGVLILRHQRLLWRCRLP